MESRRESFNCSKCVYSKLFDPHRVETMDEWVESHDIVITVSTTKTAYN